MLLSWAWVAWALLIGVVGRTWDEFEDALEMQLHCVVVHAPSPVPGLLKLTVVGCLALVSAGPLMHVVMVEGRLR
jgi:hypothetical protein